MSEDPTLSASGPFVAQRSRTPRSTGRRLLLCTITLLTGALLLGDQVLVAYPGHEPAKPLKQRPVKESPAGEQHASLHPPKRPAVDESKAVWREVTVSIRKGDTFAQALRRQDVSYQVSNNLATSARPVFNLAKELQPGDTLRLLYGPNQQLGALVYPISAKQSLLLVANPARKGGFEASKAAWPASEAVSQVAAPSAKQSAEGDVPVLRRSNSLTQNTQLADSFMAVLEPVERASKPGKGGKSADGAKARKGKSPSTRPAGVEASLYSTLRDHNDSIAEKVRKGDTLVSILGRQGVSPSTVAELAKAAKPTFNLAGSLNPGQTMRLAFAKDGDLLGLTYPMDSDRILWLTKDGKGRYTPNVEKKQFDVRTSVLTGVINDSLFESATKAGLPDTMVMKVAGLFEWDVDFARDLRAGDRFTVVFEELFHDGAKVRNGEVLAAEFTNQNKTHKAFRYVDSKGKLGYFDQQGRNVRKMFIRAPLDFTRITSHFSMNRKHPVLGYTRAHKGVDYGAPTGTPVRAAANGVVEFKGVKGGYGNFLEVRHNSKFSTGYAHLNNFARHIKPGSQVRQGEVIAYVGTTGVSTGPHLHYEVRVSGEAVNPLSIQTPLAEPLPQSEMARFKREIVNQVAQLEKRRTAVAQLITLDDESQP